VAALTKALDRARGKVRGFVPATQLEGTYRKKVEAPDGTTGTVTRPQRVRWQKSQTQIIELDRDAMADPVRTRALRECAKNKKWPAGRPERGLGPEWHRDERRRFWRVCRLGGVDGMIHLSELS